MAASISSSRAIYAGLSCGIAFAVPVCAYAVTLPFPVANGVVATCALPFTVGTLAGVGLINALTIAGEKMVDAHDTDAARSEREHDAFEHAAAHASQPEESDARHGGSHRAPRTFSARFFGKRGAPSDVPVIARAAGAPPVEDAWADIDSLFSDDSPISCDASHSKDIYQIAFEELRRGSSAREPMATTAAADATATGRMMARQQAPASQTPSAAAPAAANSTAMFMALAQQRAAAHAQQAQAAASQEPVRSMSSDRQDDARAALASLDRFGGERLARPAVAQAAPSTIRPAAAVPAQQDAATDSSDEFSDRRGVWSAALDILAEPERPAPARTHRAAQASRSVVYAQRRSSASAASASKREYLMHQHVDELIEEELDRIVAPSARPSSREYLRVIQGGTMSMLALQAEA